MAKARVLIGWALVVLIVLWVVLNLDPVVVHILIGKVQLPVAFVIIFSALMGAGAVHFLKFLRKRESK
jgi:uncharacterized integral membrane protein